MGNRFPKASLALRTGPALMARSITNRSSYTSDTQAEGLGWSHAGSLTADGFLHHDLDTPGLYTPAFLSSGGLPKLVPGLGCESASASISYWVKAKSLLSKPQGRAPQSGGWQKNLQREFLHQMILLASNLLPKHNRNGKSMESKGCPKFLPAQETKQQPAPSVNQSAWFLGSHRRTVPHLWPLDKRAL